MKTKNLIVMLAVIIIGVVVLVGARNLSENGFSAQGNSGTLQQSQDEISPLQTGDVQNVILSAQGYKYVLTPSTLKKGIPVRMEVDLNTVDGCLRSVVIPEFNVRKNVYDGLGKNIIEFTPDKTGTFNIHCSMNMGQGAFDVVDDQGQKSDYVETKAAPTNGGGSCAMGNGGSCGCMGNAKL